MNIKQIKEKYTCLEYLGDRVVRKVANGYLARCPWREDKNPSLTITKDGKGWKDQATGERGNLIKMVQLCLNTTDLSRVCAEFGTITPFSFHMSKILSEGKEKENGFAFCDIVPLQNKGLFAYLYHRKIDLQIAKQFLKEAHYGFKVRNDGRYLYALAYANDRGGYELRGAPNKNNAKGYKGGTAPKGITTHLTLPEAATVVFEGFMDVLSWATLTGGVKHNYIVLNSTVNAPAAIEVLKGIGSRIYLALDNDDAGREASSRIVVEIPAAKDISHKYAPYKDINDYLTHKK